VFSKKGVSLLLSFLKKEVQRSDRNVNKIRDPYEDFSGKIFVYI